ALETLLHHRLVALLEDVQRNELARKRDGRQQEEGEFPDGPIGHPCGVYASGRSLFGSTRPMPGTWTWARLIACARSAAGCKRSPAAGAAPVRGRPVAAAADTRRARSVARAWARRRGRRSPRARG